MSRRPSPPHGPKGMAGAPAVRALACALATTALLATAACSGGGSGSRASDVAASPLAEAAEAASARAAATSAPPRLTKAGAQAALIDEGNIEDGWNQVKDAAKWDDSLLIGKVDVADFLTAKSNAADCQKLLDSLYDDDLLGKPSGASALRGFEQGNSRLLHQVAAYGSAELSDAQAWLKTLPVKCDRFTATDSQGGKRTVEVTTGSVPAVGDSRQDLRVVVRGTANGEPATLTLDVAVVRVGDDAITVTAGGLDGAEAQSAGQAVTKGTQRLKDVLSGKTPAAGPARSR
ncbi:hypothetical protein ACIRPX_37315 [Streptomyces sp. NPDC101225]|uniref:hypothetical protein n=1 Tax=Streptomyces sp. NPDC101225 TaxID=3366135 RepID=UPI003813ABD5